MAADDLDVPMKQLEYETIKDSTRTILGLVHTGEVTIRAWALPAVSAELEAEEDEVAEEEISGPRARRVAPIAEPSAELERVVSEIVSTLLDKMGVFGAVEVVDRGGAADPDSGDTVPLTLNIVGDDLGVLIGRRGETLHSLQFIVRLLASKKLGSWPHLVLDVEGYKAKRAESLRALALRLADQVRKTGRPSILEPMPPNERRIVHLALRDEPGVYTESTGEDESRKVQIFPR